MSAVLRSIQVSAAQRLAAMPEFAEIDVISEDVKDLQLAVDTALGKVGLCVVVVTAAARASYTDTTAPYFQAIRVLVQVLECVPVNRRPENPSYQTGQQVAELCSAYLHGWAPDGYPEVFTSEDVLLGRLPPEAADRGLVAWDVPVKTQGGFYVTIPQVAPCVIDVAQQPVTIVCATAGAAIWYTTDGSYPAPRSATATLYTAPFNTGVGVTVRAQAYLAGYLASGVASAVTTTSGGWTYIGQGVRYDQDYLQLSGSNEVGFHTVQCRSPQGVPTLALGDLVAESGGYPVAGYQQFGPHVRIGTSGMQLWDADTGYWHPLMVLDLYGAPVLSLDDGVSGQPGATGAHTFLWGDSAKVDDVGLQLYNLDEERWYRVRAAAAFGNANIELDPA